MTVVPTNGDTWSEWKNNPICKPSQPSPYYTLSGTKTNNKHHLETVKKGPVYTIKLDNYIKHFQFNHIKPIASGIYDQKGNVNLCKFNKTGSIKLYMLSNNI